MNPIVDEESVGLLEKEDPTYVELMFSIEKAARNTLKGFDPPKVQNFKFVIPPTVFGAISSSINVIHNKEDANEYISTSDLNWSQRCEIFRTGKFTVKSKKFKQNYVWKMTTWIIQGRENINKHIKDDMKTARDMLKGWFHAFYRSHTSDICDANIYNGVKYSWYFIRNLASIFLGYPKIYPIDTDSTSHFVCDYQLQLNEDEHIDKHFWKYMFLKPKDPHNQLKENENYVHLRKLQEKFDSIVWKKQKHIEEKKLIDDENLKIKLVEIYYSQLEEYIKANNNQIINQENLQKLLEFHNAFKIITSFCFKYDNIYQEKLSLFKTVLTSNHSFLCKFECYYNRKFAEYQKSELLSLNTERNEKILQSLSNLKIQDPHALFSRFLPFLKFFQDNHQAANYLLREWHPYRDFSFTIQLFPSSWKVETYQDYYNNTKYRLIRTETIEYSTEHWFWRFFIMLVRYRVWVQNAMYWLFVMAIAGPLGIRALCGCEPFYPDKECDENTGEIRQSRNPEIQTVFSTFMLVMKSIEDDRNHFESQPDTGFFGKKFSRICNLIYNYIFKFIFVGLFLTLICFPLLIIGNFLICLLLAVTSFIWMPLVLVICKISHVLIYDYDNEGSHEGPGSNTYRWFPIFAEFIVTFGIFCLLQITFAVFLLIIKPVLFVLIVVFGILRYVIRSFYDFFMMLFVLLFGRVPASDTAIAWKISGPVVTRKFYDKMDIFDAMKFFISQLENIELDKFSNEVQSNLRKNQTQVEKFYHNLNAPFGVTSSLKHYDEKDNKIKKDVANIHTMRTCQSNLQKKLENALTDRRNMFPQRNVYGTNRVRYSAKDLEILENCCLEILKTFVFRRNIQDHWPEKDFTDVETVREINRTLIRSAVNSEVLEPYEELDERVELADVRPDLATIHDVMKGKSGNEVDNLRVLVVKDKKELGGIKYLAAENPIGINVLGQFDLSLDLINGIRINVNLSESNVKLAEKLREMKPKFDKINRKHFRK